MNISVAEISPTIGDQTRSTARAQCQAIAFLCLAAASVGAVAGPPLAIDDPGILNPGQYEFILAVDGVLVDDADAYNLPLLDVSRGLTENTQISFSLPRLLIVDDDGPDRAGLGFAAVGYKWRMLVTAKSEWAIAPTYAFPASHQVIREDGPEDIRLFSLPLLYQRAFGDWTALGQLAWVLGSDGSEAWDYGVALTHPVGERVEAMVELFGVTDKNLNYETLNYHIGIDIAVSEDFHLLGSVGDRLTTNSGVAERLNFRFYVGMQWFF